MNSFGDVGHKKVKMVATLGPASSSKEMILKLAKEGVDIFRINFSHHQNKELATLIKRIRSVEKKVDGPLTVLGDLAGPKIRIGDVGEKAELKEGQKIKILTKTGSKDSITLNFPTIIKNLKNGSEIYLGDGLIKLRVKKKIKNGVLAEVIIGGLLRSRMGFSAQGLVKRFSLTPKDREDIKAVLKEGVDALAISFVQTEKNIEAVKKVLPKKRPLLIAKIETMAGVKNAEKILEAADGIMIARGDLGLSVPMAKVPMMQKKLIKLALKKAKPVITATQMLESMIHNHMPTRAEVTDVANAILDGTDAVMLSGETAVGKFPRTTVEMMAKIIAETTYRVKPKYFPDDDSVADAISASVVNIANQIKAKLIIVFTQSGATAERIARHRPHQPIIALSPEPSTIHTLNFSWGVFPYNTDVHKNFEELISKTKEIAANNHVLKLKKGEPFVICCGIPFGKRGTTNLVLVKKV